MIEENEQVVIHKFLVPKDKLPRRWLSKYFPSKSTISRRAKKGLTITGESNPIISFKKDVLQQPETV